MDRLKEKIALISGGARGQGAAEARLFVGEGAKVVIGDVLDPKRGMAQSGGAVDQAMLVANARLGTSFDKATP